MSESVLHCRNIAIYVAMAIVAATPGPRARAVGAETEGGGAWAVAVDVSPPSMAYNGVQLCQCEGTCSVGAAPCGCGGSAGGQCQQCAPFMGVDSASCAFTAEPTWKHRSPIPWQSYGQGEYAGPSRFAHVDQYRLRPDDDLEFIFRLTRDQSSRPYELVVGDKIRIESLADEKLDRELVVQPDGTITVRLLPQVQAAGRTVEELRKDLEERYKKFYKVPAITVTPTEVNTKLEDLRATVDSRAGNGGQTKQARITPEGTVGLPAIGSVCAVGLTLDELKMEIDARYREIVDGLEVTPVLRQRAPRFIYVVGEVAQPGRFEMTGPTTSMQALALAGGWRTGANLRQVIVFRRAEDWRLLATKLDLRGALYGKRPVPSDEIWLRDQDIVLFPKTPIRQADDAIELLFTRGAYSLFPALGFTGQLFNTSTISN
ncbi:MAG: polysaccharide biosynthesis/export family protein [Pirellulaceae bacterium]|nr:polysaccharide biosynthesis/export family protein [Planctomycetales bacterium]